MILRNAVLVVSAIGLVMIPSQVRAQSPVPTHRDVVYGNAGGRDLLLDLYLPEGVNPAPLVVWVHGGAWRTGNKTAVPPVFVENGFAVASLDFRLSTEAGFPAQVHDIKAAIRFLRGERARFGLRTGRIAISGASPGAHLASLVGVTNGHPELEGSIGDYLGESSDVQAIVSYFGAPNLTTILGQSNPHGLGVRQPALELFLGAQPGAVPGIAQLASPVFHVDGNDPPLLLLHGDQDPQMPINQSHELEGIHRQHGLDVQFDVVHGVGHGGPEFFQGDYLTAALSFLGREVRE
ncbi:MAG: alpha/beta hydrolase fold domain-containing protein [Planctomycetota bacterium]|jgi:acetyl esterase/lipase